MSKLTPIFKTLEEMMAFYYGSPGHLLRKTELSETAGAGTHWEPVYGKKVWSFLNEEANIFAMIPKEPWVQSGWRVLKTRAHSSGGGINESTTGGSVPAAAQVSFEQVKTKPKTMAHTFDVGELAEFLSSIDDAIELLPFYREEVGKEHAFCVDVALGTDVGTLASYNLESIDRVVSSKEEEDNCGIDENDADIYGLSRDVTTYDAYVNENNNTDRDLSLTLIDTTLQSIWDNGGKPKVIITRTNSLMRWQQLLEAERRFMETARVVPTFGGVRGPAPGVEAGFMVATYFGIPILPGQNVASDTIGRIYFLDTDYLKLSVAKPTVYVETEAGKGFLYRGVFAIEGMFETMGELKAYRFNCHGKLRDLK